jgi:hypothetical protein
MAEHNSWQALWDERYRIDDYAYGIAPNEYLREQLSKTHLWEYRIPRRRRRAECSICSD